MSSSGIGPASLREATRRAADHGGRSDSNYYFKKKKKIQIPHFLLSSDDRPGGGGLPCATVDFHRRGARPTRARRRDAVHVRERARSRPTPRPRPFSGRRRTSPGTICGDRGGPGTPSSAHLPHGALPAAFCRGAGGRVSARRVSWIGPRGPARCRRGRRLSLRPGHPASNPNIIPPVNSRSKGLAGSLAYAGNQERWQHISLRIFSFGISVEPQCHGQRHQTIDESPPLFHPDHPAPTRSIVPLETMLDPQQRVRRRGQATATPSGHRRSRRSSRW